MPKYFYIEITQKKKYLNINGEFYTQKLIENIEIALQ